MAEKKVKGSKHRDGTIESLRRGGRGTLKDLQEIASMSVVDLLSAGLTLEQAEMVARMASIEIARLVEEARMLPKTPSVEVKLKKGKK